jgi:nucleotide-binding universal stress UspA family protein
MVPFSQILVATDFGVTSEQALEVAAALATRFAAHLTVIHVVESHPHAFPFSTPADLKDASRARLDEVVAALRVRLLDASGVCRDGAPAEEICATAIKIGADLVIVGSQGRRGLPRFVLGSVAERVIRSATAPVLTIHPTAYASVLAGGMGQFRNILAPTDFGEASVQAVKLAADLAREFDASLTVVHAYDLPSYDFYAIENAASDAELIARRRMGEQLADVRRRYSKVVPVVRRAVPWRGILDIADEQRADLIVLGTRGHDGRPHGLAGSVADKVIRQASVPVLTLKHGT